MLRRNENRRRFVAAKAGDVEELLAGARAMISIRTSLFRCRHSTPGTRFPEQELLLKQVFDAARLFAKTPPLLPLAEYFPAGISFDPLPPSLPTVVIVITF